MGPGALIHRKLCRVLPHHPPTPQSKPPLTHTTSWCRSVGNQWDFLDPLHVFALSLRVQPSHDIKVPVCPLSQEPSHPPPSKTSIFRIFRDCLNSSKTSTATVR